MDIYGIGTAMKAMARVFHITARGSGRTTRLIETLKDGDRVLFRNSQEADRVKRACLEKGKKITTIVLGNNLPLRRKIYELQPAPGQTYYDHTLVEDFYDEAMNDASRYLQESCRHLSQGQIEPIDMRIDGTWKEFQT